jgi:hypothetical protein
MGPECACRVRFALKSTGLVGILLHPADDCKTCFLLRMLEIEAVHLQKWLKPPNEAARCNLVCVVRYEQGQKRRRNAKVLLGIAATFRG